MTNRFLSYFGKDGCYIEVSKSYALSGMGKKLRLHERFDACAELAEAPTRRVLNDETSPGQIIGIPQIKSTVKFNLFFVPSG